MAFYRAGTCRNASSRQLCKPARDFKCKQARRSVAHTHPRERLEASSSRGASLRFHCLYIHSERKFCQITPVSPAAAVLGGTNEKKETAEFYFAQNFLAKSSSPVGEFVRYAYGKKNIYMRRRGNIENVTRFGREIAGPDPRAPILPLGNGIKKQAKQINRIAGLLPVGKGYFIISGQIRLNISLRRGETRRDKRRDTYGNHYCLGRR